MKRYFFLLMLIILASIHHTSYASTTQYKHTADNLDISRNHDIDECRVDEIVGSEVFLWTVQEGESRDFKKVEFYLIDANNGHETKIPYTLTDIFVTDAHYSGQYIYILYHDQEDRQCIRKIDKQGKILNDFRLKGIDEGQVFYDVYDWDDERIFICGNVGVAEYDLTGEKLWHVVFSPVVSYTRYGGGNRFYAMRETHLYEIDLDKNKLIGSREIEGVDIADMYVRDGKLYFFDNSGIRVCDVSNETTSYVVRFADYGIESNNYAIDFDGEQVRFVDYNPFDQNTDVTLHTVNLNSQGASVANQTTSGGAASGLTRDTAANGRQEIVFYIPEYLPFPGEVRDIADWFNRSNADYTVLYGTYTYREELDTVFNEYGADVVLMDDSKLINHKGQLLDLAPYMNGSESLKPEVLIPSVQRNYMKDNSMYLLPTELDIETYVVKADDYGKSSFSADDFMSYISGAGTLYTDYFLSKESILEALMEAGIDEFVDFEAGTCSFDSEAFKKLIKKIDGLTSENYYYPDVDYFNVSKDDRILNDCRMGNFDFFGKKRAAYGEDVTAVGVPAGETTYIMSALCLAVKSDTKCPEGAFKFLEYYINHFTALDREGAILSNREFFDKTAGEIRENLAVTDFLGTKTGVTGDDIDSVIKALDNSVARDERSVAVIEYVKHYADMFFEGEASIDVVTEELQATVTRYLNR